MEFVSTKAKRRKKDGYSLFTYRVTNNDTRKRQAMVVTDRSDGETITDVTTLEPDKSDLVTIELSPEHTATVRAVYITGGDTVMFGAALIGPLPTEGFDS